MTSLSLAANSNYSPDRSAMYALEDQARAFARSLCGPLELLSLSAAQIGDLFERQIEQAAEVKFARESVEAYDLFLAAARHEFIADDIRVSRLDKMRASSAVSAARDAFAQEVLGIEECA